MIITSISPSDFLCLQWRPDWLVASASPCETAWPLQWQVWVQSVQPGPAQGCPAAQPRAGHSPTPYSSTARATESTLYQELQTCYLPGFLLQQVTWTWLITHTRSHKLERSHLPRDGFSASGCCAIFVELRFFAPARCTLIPRACRLAGMQTS